MLATTTHDTKRSEDARTRIDVISELPDEWQAGVTAWQRLNRANRTRIDGRAAPDANDEYLFYQALLGAWPAEAFALESVPGAAPPDLVSRMDAYMHKAIKEAKLHTSWITPNTAYETAVQRFVQRTLSGPTAGGFLASFIPFAARVARIGMVNSLAQVLLKLTAPGVPDTYQGTELWDLSLVDPDNRRPVDWTTRRRMLDDLEAALAPAESQDSNRATIHGLGASLLDRWPDGRIKLFLTALVLRLRRAHPAVFLAGDYIPLKVEGARLDHVVAFARQTDGQSCITVVPRLTAALCGGSWPMDAAAWGDTAIRLPAGLGKTGAWRNLLPSGAEAGDRVRETGRMQLADVLTTWPVALLWSSSLASSAGDAGTGR